MFTRTTALIAGGAALAGAAVIGIPAIVVAATDDDERPGPGRFMQDEDWDGRGGMMQGRRGGGMMGDFGGPGAMMGGGPVGWRGDDDGRRGGMMGDGPGGGMMGGPLGWTDGEPAGELSDAQAEALAVNVEREKLARDLYTAFADATDEVRFAHLAHAESHHLNALQAMLDVYEVTDPTEGNSPGEFTDSEVAADYKAMLEKGSGSEEAALEVARELEVSLTERLEAAADDVSKDASDVSQVYEHLAFGSEHHLAMLED